jgi:hypothetical protein
MRYFSVILVLALSSFAIPKENSRTVLRKMFLRYHGLWRTTLTFTQQTERYRGDSLVSTDTWYETIVYPRFFRIDFGEPENGNCVIYRNDSAYIFKNKTLVKSRVDTNDLLFILGGMYSERSVEDLFKRLSHFHYNPEKGHRDMWKGKPVYVIGANSNNEQVNQIWVEPEHFNVVRFIKYDEGKKEEGILEQHQPLGHTWCETLVTFYIDNQLIQKEKYSGIVADEKIDTAMFSTDSPWLFRSRQPNVKN